MIRNKRSPAQEQESFTPAGRENPARGIADKKKLPGHLTGDGKMCGQKLCREKKQRRAGEPSAQLQSSASARAYLQIPEDDFRE